MQKKALVTGGSGFIGSHITDALLESGHRVVVIDNYSTGRPENLQHQKGNPNLTVVQADVNDIQTTAPYYKDVEHVFHMAGLADIVPSMERPIPYHHANVSGTIAVLECARREGVKKFVYAASSTCYGFPDVYPTPEAAAIDTHFPYALSKNLGEQYVMGWGKIYKMPVVSLRLFNVYGPRSRTSGTYGAVFGVFLAQKLNGKPYTVVGDGKQSRDFTFVSDVARAFIMAAASDVSGEVMNVGSGDHYSINRLVELLGGAVTYVPKRPGEPERTFADIAKIQRLLGWKPSISFETGVGLMLENIEYWRNAPVWTPDSIAEATRSWFEYLK